MAEEKVYAFAEIVVTGRIIEIKILGGLHIVAVETRNGTVEILVPWNFPIKRLKRDARLKVLCVACEGLARYKLLEVLG